MRQFERSPLRLAIAALALATVPAVAPAQRGEPAQPGYTLPDTEVWDMESAQGRPYRILVSRPSGPAKEPYRVLYVLDGNAMFAAFAEARRIQSIDKLNLDKIIVVGIGYPSGEVYDGRRLFDFTAPVTDPELAQTFKDYPSGGREAFLSFLTDKVRPEVARRFSIDPEKQFLFGHSLGGLFGLYAAYSHPGLFHTIVAASPSIWWDNQAILGDEQKFTARLRGNPSLGRKTRLHILVGEREEPSVMVHDATALARRMQDLSGFGVRTEFQVLDNETHITVPGRAVTTTMRAVMQQF
jgi:predicted alpha/beta superfamily hydrolase